LIDDADGGGAAGCVFVAAAAAASAAFPYATLKTPASAGGLPAPPPAAVYPLADLIG